MASGLLDISTMRGFPPLCDNKIPTKEFLDACLEIVGTIENLSRVFEPLATKIRNNVGKLEKVYNQNPKDYNYVENIVIAKLQDEYAGPRPLHWINLTLDLIYCFFENILNDTQQQENVDQFLKDAYDRTLSPFNTLLQHEAFLIFYQFVPYRTTIFGTNLEHETKHFDEYLKSMKIIIDKNNQLFLEYNLYQK